MNSPKEVLFIMETEEIMDIIDVNEFENVMIVSLLLSHSGRACDLASFIPDSPDSPFLSFSSPECL
jgi:hypothetical protein